MSNLTVISSSEFQTKVLKNPKVVLVDFFATWCGPCKMLAPILEQVLSESDGKFDIFKIDIDNSMDLAREYGIMSVPSMFIFKNGKLAEKLIGLRQKSQILEAIEKNI